MRAFASMLGALFAGCLLTFFVVAPWPWVLAAAAIFLGLWAARFLLVRALAAVGMRRDRGF